MDEEAVNGRHRSKSSDGAGSRVLYTDVYLYPESGNWWYRWAYTCLVSVLHAFTLGPILNNGVVLATIASPSSIALPTASTVQYILFLAASMFLLVCERVLDRLFGSGKWHVTETHTLVLLNLVLVIVGHVSLNFSASLEKVVFVWIVFVGLCGGIVYWLTVRKLTELFRPEAPVELFCGARVDRASVALGWVSLAPAIYTSVFPQVHTAICRSAASHARCMQLTQYWLMGASLMASLVYLLCWVNAWYHLRYLTEDDEREALLPILYRTKPRKDARRAGNKGKDVSIAYSNVETATCGLSERNWKLAAFALGCVCFQAAFYIPYLKLPQYMALQYTDSQRAMTATLLGVGSVVGRFLGAVVSAYQTKRVYYISSVCAFLCFIPFVLWLAESKRGPDWGMLNACVTIFGIFSGACFALFKVAVKRFDELSLGSAPPDACSQTFFVYGSSLAIGAVLSVAMVEGTKVSYLGIQVACMLLPIVSAAFFLLSARLYPGGGA